MDGRMSFKFVARNPVSKWRWDTLLTKEPATIAWIDAMPEGAVFWDIGANIGIYSIYAAARGIDVVAVEANHQLFAELCENIVLNKFHDFVTPSFMALGTRRGETSLNAESLFAPALSLDDLSEILDHMPMFVKIDTDGSDLDILKGARAVLAEAQSVIVEVDEKRRDACQIRDLMGAAGFVRTGRHVCPLTPESSIGMDHWSRV